MGLIMYGENAKNDVMEVIVAAKSGDFELVDKGITGTEESLVRTYHSQTEALTGEARGSNMQVTSLTVHSQDHLVTAAAFTGLAKEIIDLYRHINNE